MSTVQYPKTSAEYITMEDKHGAHNYHPIPAVLCKGKGPKMFDIEGKDYYDFLSGYSAVSQGHCHPRIVKAMQKQCETLCLTSRAFHNNILGPYAKFITEFLGYERILPMNSGAEGGETAVKLCRKWGYKKKGIPANQAQIIFAKNNFWGRTIAACSVSSDPECSGGFGPFTPGFISIDYNSIPSLEKALNEHGKTVAALYIEPIQGEAGVVVPDDGYLKKAYDLCKKHNVLFVADEIQTGLCRTGTMMCCDHDGVKPDVLILGKALSGGSMPVSAVLSSSDIMLCIEPGQHGSTYGGNPIACAVAIEALQILRDEKLAENAVKMGEVFRARMKKMGHSWLEVRGRGLLNALVVDEKQKFSAWDVCIKLMENGILTKPIHGNIIRMAPVLTITLEEMNDACDRIEKAFSLCK